MVGRTVGLDCGRRHGHALAAGRSAGRGRASGSSSISPSQPGSFRSGDLLSFGIDRDEADGAGPVDGAAGGNSADLLGGGVLIPSGHVVLGRRQVLRHVRRRQPFQGRFFNLIGKGYSQLDGFGFVNAEAAVKAVSEEALTS